MFVKVTRGGRIGGLMAYLAGPGRANEHANPRVVAGDPALVAAVEDGDLRDRARVREAAQELDGPRVAHETAVLVKQRPAHVWHASLALHADEGALTDERWRAVSEDFVERMGYGDCRWAAVRHGLSKAGNDHVHVVVNLVQEDGSPANTSNDWRRAKRVAGELEHAHALRVMERRELGVGARGYHQAEVAIAAEVAEAKGLDSLEPARDYLERVVRAAAVEARDEHDFVRRVRERGVKVQVARYEPGSADRVAAYKYSVPGSREYAGGRLARDLTTPRLRQRWASPTPQTVDQAAHRAAGRLAAASLRAERGAPGPLAQESRELARYAQTRAGAAGLVLPVAAAQLLRERIHAAEQEAQRAEEYLRDLDRDHDEQRARRHQARDRGPELEL